MILRDLIKQLQELAEFHGDYLEVKHVEPEGAQTPSPVTLAFFEYNDDETEAWITIE